AQTDLQALLPHPRPGSCSRERHRAWTVHRAIGRETPRRPRLGGKRRTGTRQHLRAGITHRQMKRVLLVEDEQHLAEGLRYNLEAEGYQVRVAETGEAALSALNEESPGFDIVVLDVMLPGKDGFAVISELRGKGQFIPTLMLTARSHPEDVLKG